MRIVLKKTVDRDYMGGKSTTTKIVIEDIDGSDLLRLPNDIARDASRRLGAPPKTDMIDVSDAMREAARKVFLSPGRVEALSETLTDVYRAMEQARRSAGE